MENSIAHQTENAKKASIKNGLRNRRRKENIGEIDESFFAYVPPKLIILGLIFITFAGLSYETLWKYFNTNVFLNGLIISLIIFACGMVVENCLIFRRTAFFLKDIEEVSQKEHIEDEEIRLLKRRLTRQGRLLNTKNMHDVLNRLGTYHHPNFTDADARLIKSKMGGRINYRRKGIVFIAGMLVMLGLLGTFMGLLQTIDAVGLALNNMSNMGSSGGKLGLKEMSGFIGSLSGPLQGMGLAFSSSLFGLTGSLIINVFNTVSGDAQNNFVENVSRWIDDRILSSNKAMAGAKGAAPAANSDDLQTWLAGFIYLSNKTNKRLSKLSMLLYRSYEHQVDVGDTCKEIAAYQKDSLEALKEMLGEVATLKDNSNVVGGTVQKVLDKAENIAENQQVSLGLLNKQGQVSQEISKYALEQKENLQNVMEQVRSSSQVSKEQREEFINLMTGAVERQIQHIDSNSDAMRQMMNKGIETLHHDIKMNSQVAKDNKDEVAKAISNSVDRQVAHMDRSTEMLSSILSDMFDDMNNKVESNVLEFVQKKDELEEVRQELSAVVNSQDDIQDEMHKLILEMQQHSKSVSNLNFNKKVPADSDDASSKRNIVQKLFSSNDN